MFYTTSYCIKDQDPAIVDTCGIKDDWKWHVNENVDLIRITFPDGEKTDHIIHSVENKMANGVATRIFYTNAEKTRSIALQFYNDPTKDYAFILILYYPSGWQLHSGKNFVDKQ